MKETSGGGAGRPHRRETGRGMNVEGDTQRVPGLGGACRAAEPGDYVGTRQKEREEGIIGLEAREPT